MENLICLVLLVAANDGIQHLILNQVCVLPHVVWWLNSHGFFEVWMCAASDTTSQSEQRLMSNDTLVGDPSDRNYSWDLKSKSRRPWCVYTRYTWKKQNDNNGEKGDLDATAMFENAIVVTSASVSLIGSALIGCFLPHTTGHMLFLLNMEACWFGSTKHYFFFFTNVQSIPKKINILFI